MRSYKIDQGTARALNRSLILNELRRHGATNRARLAERTGLSGAAISLVAAGLLEERLLVERDGTGRRPVPLDVNYEGHVAVGLKLMQNRVEAVLTDLSIRPLAALSVPLDSNAPEHVADRAAAAARTLLGGPEVAAASPVGLGLGLPGVIDPARGLCLQSHRLDWHSVPIADLVAERAGVPVFADNDVNAFAAAERLFGRGRTASSFAVVTLGRGIGAALVLDGRLYRGRNGGAGELGHTLSEEGGRPCECGRRGCLEAYLSEPALLAQLIERAPTSAARTDDLAGLAASGDGAALELLDEAGRRLGRSLGDLLNLFNPELLVVGGEGVRLGEPLFAPMRAALRERAFGGVADDLPVFVDAWGDDAWARGAAALAVEQFFDLKIRTTP